MRIAKPVRVLMSALGAGGTAGAVGGALYLRIDELSVVTAMLAFVPAWLLWSAVIDHLDLWLRRRTRDEGWPVPKTPQT